MCSRGETVGPRWNEIFQHFKIQYFSENLISGKKNDDLTPHDDLG